MFEKLTWFFGNFTILADGLLGECNFPWMWPWPCPDKIPSTWHIFRDKFGNSMGVVISCGWTWLRCQLMCSIWWITLECSSNKSCPICSIWMSSFFLSLLNFALRDDSNSSIRFSSSWSELNFDLISHRSFNCAFMSFNNCISILEEINWGENFVITNGSHWK